MPLFGNQLPPTTPPPSPPPSEGINSGRDKRPDITSTNKFPSISSQKTQGPMPQNPNAKPSIFGSHQGSGGFSIFRNKKEISRKELKNEMRNDPTVFKLQKQSGLHLNRAERGNLVKKIFPKALGGNISKSDLKLGIHYLNKEKLMADSPKEKGTLRREITFLKKLGK